MKIILLIVFLECNRLYTQRVKKKSIQNYNSKRAHMELPYFTNLNSTVGEGLVQELIVEELINDLEEKLIFNFQIRTKEHKQLGSLSQKILKFIKNIESKIKLKCQMVQIIKFLISLANSNFSDLLLVNWNSEMLLLIQSNAQIDIEAQVQADHQEFLEQLDNQMINIINSNNKLTESKLIYQQLMVIQQYQNWKTITVQKKPKPIPIKE